MKRVDYFYNSFASPAQGSAQWAVPLKKDHRRQPPQETLESNLRPGGAISYSRAVRSAVLPQIKFGVCGACIATIFSLQTLENSINAIETGQKLNPLAAREMLTQKITALLSEGRLDNAQADLACRVDTAGRNRLTPATPRLGEIIRRVLALMNPTSASEPCSLGSVPTSLIAEISEGIDNFTQQENPQSIYEPKNDGNIPPLPHKIIDIDDRTESVTFPITHFQRGVDTFAEYQMLQPVGWVTFQVDDQSLNILSSQEFPTYSGLNTAESGIANVVALALMGNRIPDNLLFHMTGSTGALDQLEPLSSVFVAVQPYQKDLMSYLENKFPQQAIQRLDNSSQWPKNMVGKLSQGGFVYKIDLKTLGNKCGELLNSSQNPANHGLLQNNLADTYTELMTVLLGLTEVTPAQAS